MAETTDEQIKDNVINALEKIKGQAIEAIQKATIESMEDIIVPMVKALGEDEKEIEGFLAALGKEGISFRGSIKEINEAAKKKGEEDSALKSMEKGLNVFRRLLNSMQGDLTNVLMEFARQDSGAMAGLNIFQAVIDIFTKLESTVIEANSTLIGSYTALGSINKLNLDTLSTQMSKLNKLMNVYGITNEDSQAAVKAFANAGLSINNLSKSYKISMGKSKSLITTLIDTLGTYSKLFGTSTDEMATIMGNMHYSLRSSEKDIISNIAFMKQSQKTSGIHSTAFLEAVNTASEKSYLYGDYTKSNANYLAYLGSIAGSSGKALEMFQGSSTGESTEGIYAEALKYAFSSNDPKVASIAKEIKAGLEGKAKKAESQGNKGLSTLLFNITKGITLSKDGEGASVDRSALYRLIKNVDILPKSARDAVSALFVTAQKGRDSDLATASLLGIPIASASFGLKRLAEDASKIIKSSFKLEKVKIDEDGEKAKDIAKHTYSLTEKIKDTLNNLLLDNLGDKITVISKTIKNTLDTLTNSRFLTNLFSGNITTEMQRMAFDKVTKAKLGDGILSKVVTFIGAGVIGAVDVATKSMDKKLSWEDVALYNMENLKDSIKHGLGMSYSDGFESKKSEYLSRIGNIINDLGSFNSTIKNNSSIFNLEHRLEDLNAYKSARVKIGFSVSDNFKEAVKIINTRIEVLKSLNKNKKVESDLRAERAKNYQRSKPSIYSTSPSL